MNHNYPLYSDHPLYESMEAFVDGIASRYGEKPAFSFRRHPKDPKPTVISYLRFAEDVRALSNELVRRGVPGVHCAIIGKLSYEWICIYVALQRVGAVAVPLDRDWTGEDLAATVKSANCRFCFADGDLYSKVEAIVKENTDCVAITMDDEETGIPALIVGGKNQVAPEMPKVDPRAMSALVFTSGTTGKGKGVMLTQFGILSNAYNGLRIIRAGERAIDALPPHHTYGSNIGILALMYTGTQIYLSSGIKYILHEMKEFRPDCMILVPLFVETFYRRIQMSVKESGKDKLVSRMMKVSNALRRVGIDLRRTFFRQILDAFGGELNLMICGGAPLRPELVHYFDALGITLLNGYGITECSPLIGANRNRFNRVGSVGTPIPSMQVRIEQPNEDGEGEICVRGDSVMLGYYGEPELTAEVIDSDGFFHTGDIGRLDEDGVVFITGRCKNLIILANGKNVYPEEIETVLSGIPGVIDVVVYEGVSRCGSDHNQVVAEIYPDKDFLQKSGITDPEAYFREHVEEYNRTAVPYKKVGLTRVRSEEFPKNTLRKIMRFKLDTHID